MRKFYQFALATAIVFALVAEPLAPCVRTKSQY